MATAVQIQDLPNEVLFHIADQLDPQQLRSNMAPVCTHFHEIVLKKIEKIKHEMQEIKQAFPKSFIDTFGLVHLYQIPQGDFGDYKDLEELENNMENKSFVMLRGYDHFLTLTKKAFIAAKVDNLNNPNKVDNVVLIHGNTLPSHTMKASFYDISNPNLHLFFKKLNRGEPCGELKTAHKNICFKQIVESSPKCLHQKSVVALHPVIAV